MESLVEDSLFEEQAKARFFLAMSYMETGNFPEAEKALSKVPEGSAFAAPVQWYQALCVLKKGDAARAKTMLQEIASEPVHIHKKEAEKLAGLL
ncbi:MAG: hypothetical protein R3B47_21300 [Bacteroidia bacterium]